MANQARGVGTVRKHFTKAEIAAREAAEEMVVTNQSTPKANEMVRNHAAMRKVFNKLKKLNDHFTEADSIALNTLAFNLYLKTSNESKLIEYDIEDESYERFLMRIEKINKMINETMKQLCIPLNARLSLANDMAKVMIEEQKLETMREANKPQEVNPLLAMLEDDDDE